MKKLISKALYETATKTQWNLDSKAACDMLAEKVVAKLGDNEKVFVRVDVNGNTLEDIRVFRRKPINLGDTSDLDGSWDNGFKVFEIEVEE